MPHNYRLELTARLFLGEGPQLKRSVRHSLLGPHSLCIIIVDTSWR